jgi:hypothetical protein
MLAVMIDIINLGEGLGGLARGIFLLRRSVSLLLLHFGWGLFLLLGTCEEEAVFIFILGGFSLLIVELVLIIPGFFFVFGK